MARDIAQRQLDQNGFRISNLGTPEAAGDATKTDNTSTPLPNSGEGAPGRSFLAAPIDHVHPFVGGGVGAPARASISDVSRQAVTGVTEELISEHFVDFNGITTERMKVAFSAIVKTTNEFATLRVRIGGSPGVPDGTEVCVMGVSSKEWKADDITTNNVANPKFHALVKITAQAATNADTVEVYGKTVECRAGV